jgi:PAS domain S-box-containing protein
LNAKTSATTGTATTTCESTVLSSLTPELLVQRQQGYFRALTEQSLDIISVIDGTGVIRFQSPSLERWTGWKPEELVGQSAFELIHPDDRPHVQKQFEESVPIAGTIAIVEYRYRHKNGTWRVIESWGKNLLQDESVSGVVLNSRDITDRKKEERRREAVAQLMSDLNAIETIDGAGNAIASITDQLFRWDAFSFAVCSPGTKNLTHILNVDIVGGRRRVVPTPCGTVQEDSLTSRVIDEGPKLIRRESGATTMMGLPFGDTSRPSACMMFVPMRGTRGIGAILAIHSYTPGAYDENDLAVFQHISDCCSAALERIRARSELLENEQRYRNLVESLPVSVLLHGEGQILFANHAAVQLLGAKSTTDLLGREVMDIVPPEARARIQARIDSAQNGGTPPWLEQQVVRFDGTRAEVEGASLSSHFSGRPAVQTIFREITDRKRAEQRQSVLYAATRALAQAPHSDTLAQVLQIVCDGMGWLLGEIWQIDDVSRALRLHTATSQQNSHLRAFVDCAEGFRLRKGDGLAGRVWQHKQVLAVPDIPNEPGFLRRELAIANGIKGAVALPLNVRGDVVAVAQFFGAEPCLADADVIELLKVLGALLGQFLERKQIQEQLLQSQKMEAIGQLAGGVAHDFNNLLTIITGHTQLAMAASDLAPQVSDELKEISTAVERAAKLTRQLLTFSRKQVMQSQKTGLDAVLNELAKMLRRIIGEQVTLTLQHARDLPPVVCDIGMIEQLVMNLAVNARDAMPEGGDLWIETSVVTLGPEAARRWPQARAGQFVQLEVRDNGCGMSEEILPRMFEPFFTTKPLGQGTGLGLATAYGIAQQHQGWIQVDSRVNVGTTFRIFFPVCAEAAAANAAEPMTNSQLRGAEQVILLVEDEDSLRGLARKLMERSGYQVVEASSGSEALDLWRQHREKIDLVLTDMVMPGGMTGRELALKLWSDDPALRIIFTSGYSMELGGRMLEQERIHFLAKPYSPQQLLRMIHDTLGEGSNP